MLYDRPLTRSARDLLQPAFPESFRASAIAAGMAPTDTALSGEAARALTRCAIPMCREAIARARSPTLVCQPSPSVCWPLFRAILLSQLPGRAYPGLIPSWANSTVSIETAFSPAFKEAPDHLVGYALVRFQRLTSVPVWSYSTMEMFLRSTFR